MITYSFVFVIMFTPNPLRPGLVSSVIAIEPVPIAGFAVNFSLIPRIAPPPCGRFTPGGCMKNLSPCLPPSAFASLFYSYSPFPTLYFAQLLYLCVLRTAIADKHCPLKRRFCRKCWRHPFFLFSSYICLLCLVFLNVLYIPFREMTLFRKRQSAH